MKILGKTLFGNEDDKPISVQEVQDHFLRQLYPNQMDNLDQIKKSKRKAARIKLIDNFRNDIFNVDLIDEVFVQGQLNRSAWMLATALGIDISGLDQNKDFKTDGDRGRARLYLHHLMKADFRFRQSQSAKKYPSGAIWPTRGKWQKVVDQSNHPDATHDAEEIDDEPDAADQPDQQANDQFGNNQSQTADRKEFEFDHDLTYDKKSQVLMNLAQAYHDDDFLIQLQSAKGVVPIDRLNQSMVDAIQAGKLSLNFSNGKVMTSVSKDKFTFKLLNKQQGDDAYNALLPEVDRVVDQLKQAGTKSIKLDGQCNPEFMEAVVDAAVMYNVKINLQSFDVQMARYKDDPAAFAKLNELKKFYQADAKDTKGDRKKKNSAGNSFGANQTFNTTTSEADAKDPNSNDPSDFDRSRNRTSSYQDNGDDIADDKRKKQKREAQLEEDRKRQQGIYQAMLDNYNGYVRGRKGPSPGMGRSL